MYLKGRWEVCGKRKGKVKSVWLMSGSVIPGLIEREDGGASCECKINHPPLLLFNVVMINQDAHFSLYIIYAGVQIVCAGVFFFLQLNLISFIVL